MPVSDNTLSFPLGGPLPGVIPQELRHDAFGKDILFRAGDLTVSHTGDWATVEGIDNLRLSIYRRFMTRPGEYRLRPTYGVGLPSYVKRAMSESTLAQLRQAIIENLREERRIEEVVSITLSPFVVNNADPALRVLVVVRCIGREVKFPPFDVRGER